MYERSLKVGVRAFQRSTVANDSLATGINLDTHPFNAFDFRVSQHVRVTDDCRDGASIVRVTRRP
jgi:hypothetical protein